MVHARYCSTGIVAAGATDAGCRLDVGALSGLHVPGALEKYFGETAMLAAAMLCDV